MSNGIAGVGSMVGWKGYFKIRKDVDDLSYVKGERKELFEKVDSLLDRLLRVEMGKLEDDSKKKLILLIERDLSIVDSKVLQGMVANQRTTLTKIRIKRAKVLRKLKGDTVAEQTKQKLSLLARIDAWITDRIFSFEVMLGLFLLWIGSFLPIYNVSLIGVVFILMGCFGRVYYEKHIRRKCKEEEEAKKQKLQRAVQRFRVT